MMIANLRFDKNMYTREQARSWARRHGYRITLPEETSDNYIFWQVEKDFVNGSFKNQPIKDGVSADLVDISENMFFNGIYPEEVSNGKVILVRDRFNNIYPVRARNLQQARFIVSRNENIPLNELDARYESDKGGWWMGIGGVEQPNIPNNPQKRATPPGDIHNYEGGKEPEDMMKDENDFEPVDVKVKDLKDDIDDLRAKVYKILVKKKPQRMISKDEEPVEEDNYFQINEDAKLSPSAGYNIPGGDDYMNVNDVKKHFEQGVVAGRNVIAVFDTEKEARSFIGNNKKLSIQKTLNGKWAVIWKGKESVQVVFEAGLNPYYE